MPQLSRALASEPLLAAHLLGPLCAVISGHRSTRLHHEIPALRKPSSSSSRKSPLTARYQPLVYSRIVGNPYLGIISGLSVIQEVRCVGVLDPIPTKPSCVVSFLPISTPQLHTASIRTRAAMRARLGRVFLSVVDDRVLAKVLGPVPQSAICRGALPTSSRL